MFSRVILPLSRPVLAVIFIITFIGIYSEHILARTLLRSADNLTLALGLQLFVSKRLLRALGQPVRRRADRGGAHRADLPDRAAADHRRPHPRRGQGLTARERFRRKRSEWMPISSSEP